MKYVLFFDQHYFRIEIIFFLSPGKLFFEKTHLKKQKAATTGV
jgi:hypothetical protein